MMMGTNRLILLETLKASLWGVIRRQSFDDIDDVFKLIRRNRVKESDSAVGSPIGQLTAVSVNKFH